MKVKIFSFSFQSSEETEQTESAINEWLEKNPAAKIRFITHTEIGHIPPPAANEPYTVISIWYEENLSPQ